MPRAIFLKRPANGGGSATIYAHRELVDVHGDARDPRNVQSADYPGMAGTFAFVDVDDATAVSLRAVLDEDGSQNRWYRLKVTADVPNLDDPALASVRATALPASDVELF